MDWGVKCDEQLFKLEILEAFFTDRSFAFRTFINKILNLFEFSRNVIHLWFAI